MSLWTIYVSFGWAGRGSRSRRKAVARRFDLIWFNLIWFDLIWFALTFEENIRKAVARWFDLIWLSKRISETIGRSNGSTRTMGQRIRRLRTYVRHEWARCSTYISHTESSLWIPIINAAAEFDEDEERKKIAKRRSSLIQMLDLEGLTSTF